MKGKTADKDLEDQTIKELKIQKSIFILFKPQK